MLLQLARSVTYCWLQSCLFCEADGIQLCGKEQHLRDATATPGRGKHDMPDARCHNPR